MQLESRRQAMWGLLFALPAIALLAAFSLYPMARAFYFSLTDYDLRPNPAFVGIENYVRVLGSSAFLNSLRVSVVYVFGTVIPVWLVSFGLASLLFNTRRGSGAWRTVLFLPTVVPLLTVTLVWKLFFNYRGVVNALLDPFLAGEPIAWLTKSAYAPLALIMTSWWHAASYYMILFLAGRQAVPAAHEEAAQIEGAGAWQRLRWVVLPHMRRDRLVMVICAITAFRTFDLQHG